MLGISAQDVTNLRNFEDDALEKLNLFDIRFGPPAPRSTAHPRAAAVIRVRTSMMSRTRRLLVESL
jgi:hypothetical protein